MKTSENLRLYLQNIVRTGPPYREYGLCKNVRYVASVDYQRNFNCALDMMQQLMQKWPKFSGDPEYPVPGIGDISPKGSYIYANDKWAGEYGELRMEMVQWMIQQLQPRATLPMDALQIALQAAGYTCTEAKQYIDNVCAQHYDKYIQQRLEKCAHAVRDDAAVAIACAFIWKESQQGHAYWAKIEQRLLSHSRL